MNYSHVSPSSCRMPRPALAAVLAALVAAALLLGPGSGAAAKDDTVTDRRITNAVEDEILVDHVVGFDDVDVETLDGIVTLRGTVDSLLEKKRAARIASTVKGVRSIVNLLVIEPVFPRSDAAIRSDVKAALLEDPATESFEIGVRVENGEVTLSGTVDSWQERTLAEKVAAGVKGVRKGINNISVAYTTERSDLEIKPEVEKILAFDTLVDDALIDVAVSDGRVTLSGTVGSLAEKNRAVYDAWVAGVKDIDAEALEVARWARDEDLREEKYAARSDEEIEEAVKDALVHDPRVYSFNVAPESSNGVVTLRGTVDNLSAKRAAEADAERTVGVISVRNRLKVRPGGGLTDEEIEDRVRAAFVRDPYVERFELLVDVYDGTAYLSGVADSYFEKARAENVASGVEGVILVVNNIDVTLANVPLPRGPYVDTDFPYDYGWYTYDPTPRVFESDAAIRQEIEDELFWSPFVDADEVTVTVVSGVATLTGTVDSYLEERSAVENAFEGGVRVVENELRVR